MSTIKLVRKDLFLKSPRDGVLICGNSFYTKAKGTEKVRTREYRTRSDIVDNFEISYSNDNGQSWSSWKSIKFISKTSKGTFRKYIHPGFVDVEKGLLLRMANNAFLPNDDPMEGMKNFYLSYQVSSDGGRTNIVDEQAIQYGGYTSEHPFEYVWVGKNCMMLGDITCRPIRTSSDKILVPVTITPIGPDGEYYNPGGGYTYSEALVLIGTWKKGNTIKWEVSERIANDPAKSTRGCDEPTLIEMPNKDILMVIRGSNGGTEDPQYEKLSYKWYSISSDGGYTWGPVKPWTYTDGKLFFSPASCSQLLKHSNGNCYWIGNITPKNPQGNSPRYPLVIAEVDKQSGLLIKDTVVSVDDRLENDPVGLNLSNLMAHEDRQTGEILIHMSRFIFLDDKFNGDSYLYRIAVMD